MVLFVATLLASVWAFCILIAALRAQNTALWIAFWDLVALGGLIAGVATTANTANYACNAVTINTDPMTVFYTAGGEPITLRPAASPPLYGVATATATTATTATTTTIATNATNATNATIATPEFWDDPNNCNLIKGAWGLAIANIVMFFITAMLAIVVYKSFQQEVLGQQHFRRHGIVEKYIASADYPQRPRRAKRGSRYSRSSANTRRSSSYLYTDTL